MDSIWISRRDTQEWTMFLAVDENIRLDQKKQLRLLLQHGFLDTVASNSNNLEHWL